MSDHLDAPGLMSPAGDPEIDITDLYAFQKPGDPSKSILILNVNPLAPTLANAFESQALYEINVDTNGDAITDIAFVITFTPNVAGMQKAVVRVSRGSDAARLSASGDTIIEGAPVSFGSTPIVTTSDDFKFFAGFRSDPFFFDLAWFLNGLPLPHTTVADFFVDKNVFGIVLEVPNSALGTNPNIGVWARTAKRQSSGTLVQIDRVGRPAINTVFNHDGAKNTFNSITPDQDRDQFEASFIATLESLGAALGGTGYSAADAQGIAEILLPDILTYDFSSAAGFLNGRMLADDVIDIALGLVTNGARTTDMVGPHTDYLSDFPYLGTPH
jgi:Domain of unknown function (DUF4331)